MGFIRNIFTTFLAFIMLNIPEIDCREKPSTPPNNNNNNGRAKPPRPSSPKKSITVVPIQGEEKIALKTPLPTSSDEENPITRKSTQIFQIMIITKTAKKKKTKK